MFASTFHSLGHYCLLAVDKYNMLCRFVLISCRWDFSQEKKRWHNMVRWYCIHLPWKDSILLGYIQLCLLLNSWILAAEDCYTSCYSNVSPFLTLRRSLYWLTLMPTIRLPNHVSWSYSFLFRNIILPILNYTTL